MNQDIDEPARNETQEKEDQAPPVRTGSLKPVETKTEEPNCTTSKKQCCEKQKSSWPIRIEAACAVLLVFITGFYTYYARQQAGAAIKAANAAKSAADTATAALHISERAYVSVISDKIDLDKKVVTLDLSNGGRIPSGRVEAVIHEMTVDKLAPFDVSGNAIEHVWKRYYLPYFPANSIPFHIDLPLPAASKVKLEGGLQVVVVAGTITYTDGFPDDPPGQWPVCLSTVWHLIEKRIFLVPCDPEVEIPKMEALDGYPNNEQK
jgi:hypothetical protein